MGYGFKTVTSGNGGFGHNTIMKRYYATGDKPNALQLFRTVNDQQLGNTFKSGRALVKDGLGKDVVEPKKYET